MPPHLTPLPRIALQRPGDADPSVVDELLQKTKKADRDGHRRIRCPLCRWTPRAHDRWMCSCAHVWNTFDTRGVCPACSFAWQMTKCLRCHLWSRHEDWYAPAGEPTP